MDYLTIIATRSLVLFPITSGTAERPLSASSIDTLTPFAKPSTTLPRPSPVTIPIHSLMHSDTDCAYFLLTHIFTSHPTSTMIVANHLCGINKELTREAEILVWSEIDRAKMFIRDLGRWCGDHPERITLGELQNLAVKWVLEFQMTPEERAEVSMWDEDRSLKRHNRSGDCASYAKGDHGLSAGDTVVSA